MCEATPSLPTYLHDVVFTMHSDNFTFEESSCLGCDNLKDHGGCIISLLGLFNPDDDGTTILHTSCSRTHCHISENFSLQQQQLENHKSHNFTSTFYSKGPAYIFLCHHQESVPFYDG
jgi:hypothetical protein